MSEDIQEVAEKLAATPRQLWAPFESAEQDQIGLPLLRAKSKMRNPKRTSQAHKNKYAKLDAVLAAIKYPLFEEGIDLRFTPLTIDGEPYMVCRFVHVASQQYTGGAMRLLTAEKSMQGVGSASTYAMRYLPQWIAAIAPDDGADDDGIRARGGPNRQDDNEKEFEEAISNASTLQELSLIGRDLRNSKLPPDVVKALGRLGAAKRNELEEAEADGVA